MRIRAVMSVPMTTVNQIGDRPGSSDGHPPIALLTEAPVDQVSPRIQAKTKSRPDSKSLVSTQTIITLLSNYWVAFQRTLFLFKNHKPTALNLPVAVVGGMGNQKRSWGSTIAKVRQNTF
jgi:hypothetical protein